MSDSPRMLMTPHGVICSQCKYYFMALLEGNRIVSRHQSVDDCHPSQDYLIALFKACPLSGKKFAFEKVLEVVGEEIAE